MLNNSIIVASDSESETNENTYKQQKFILDDSSENEQNISTQVSSPLDSVMSTNQVTIMVEKHDDNHGKSKMCKYLSKNLMTQSEGFLYDIQRDHIVQSKVLLFAVNENPLQQIRMVAAFMISGLYSNAFRLLQSDLRATDRSEIQNYENENLRYDSKQKDNQIIYSMNSCKDLYQLEGISKYSLQNHKILQAKQGTCIQYVKITIGQNVYECQLPEMKVTGELYSNRILSYTGFYLIKCQQTKLNAEINFVYNPQSTLSLVGGRIQNVFIDNQKKKINLETFTDVSVYKKILFDSQEFVIPMDNGQQDWLDGISFSERMNQQIYERLLKQYNKQNQDIVPRRKSSVIKKKQFYEEDYLILNRSA